MKSPEAYALLFETWHNLTRVKVMWELAVVVASFALAWWLHRALTPRLIRPESKWATGLTGLQRVLFPLAALVLALVGHAILGEWQKNALLHVVIPLLLAIVIIRAIAYMMRTTFAPGGALDAVERAVAWIVWVGFALYLTGLAPAVTGYLDGIGFGSGKNHFSLLLILRGALSVLLTLMVALWLGSLLEGRLMRADGLQMNLRVMFAKLAQALLVLAAILVALPAVGIDLTVLSVFGGALGVGLGFGLQKIASNYVSGFIILMDRSVSLGDMVTVDRFSGQITKMTARYVVLRGLDGTETLVPNDTLVTSPVVNNSYSDPSVCATVTVSIDYSSDPEAALRIMEDAARRQVRVMRQPPPAATVRQLGERGIELELGFWIEDPQLGVGPLRSELLRDILRGFRESGIAFPPPTRDAKPAPAPAPASPTP